jgi:hypothetical protein
VTQRNIFPIVYGSVPFFRMVFIYWTFGGAFFSKYVLIYSVLQFFPDVLITTYDNGGHKNERFFHWSVNSTVATIIITMLVLLNGQDYALYMVLGYVLVDHILCVQMPERSLCNNSLQLFLKILGAILIAVDKIPFLLLISILSLSLNLLHRADNSSNVSLFKRLVTAGLTSPFSRLRDFSTMVIFQSSVNEFAFFILNMGARAINAGLALNYQRLRYAPFKLSVSVRRIVKTVVIYLIIGAFVVAFFARQFGDLTHLLAYLMLMLALETMVTQFTVLGVKDSLKRILAVNIWTSLIIAGASLYFPEFYSISVIMMLASINIIFYVKSWPLVDRELRFL